jgi:hypothetical protein
MTTIDRRTFLTVTLASLGAAAAPAHAAGGEEAPVPGASAGRIANLGLFSDADLRAIDRDNAVRLLPRFKT